MITEDYVSFETAKLLKEKGFDEKCDKKYFGDDCSGPSYIRDSLEDGGDVCPMSNSDLNADISAPTLQMTTKWLREVHDIYIMIDKDFATEKGWHYVVTRKQDWDNNIDNGLTQQESNSYTYEFACEAAIKYCLQNLI